jgi:hypothetical protein
MAHHLLADLAFHNKLRVHKSAHSLWTSILPAFAFSRCHALLSPVTRKKS